MRKSLVLSICHSGNLQEDSDMIIEENHSRQPWLKPLQIVIYDDAPVLAVFVRLDTVYRCCDIAYRIVTTSTSMVVVRRVRLGTFCTSVCASSARCFFCLCLVL